MWKIRPDEVRILRGRGGEDFTDFVDDVIRAAAWVGGLQHVDINTNLKTSLQDGGVDTTVMRAVPNDRSGWLTGPSAWQYKAKNWGDIESASELLEGWRIRELVKEGYSYRLAVADSLGEPGKIKTWEQNLTKEMRKVNRKSPPARVLTAVVSPLSTKWYKKQTARIREPF